MRPVSTSRPDSPWRSPPRSNSLAPPGSSYSQLTATEGRTRTAPPGFPTAITRLRDTVEMCEEIVPLDLTTRPEEHPDLPTEQEMFPDHHSNQEEEEAPQDMDSNIASDHALDLTMDNRNELQVSRIQTQMLPCVPSYPNSMAILRTLPRPRTVHQTQMQWINLVLTLLSLVCPELTNATRSARQTQVQALADFIPHPLPLDEGRRFRFSSPHPD